MRFVFLISQNYALPSVLGILGGLGGMPPGFHIPDSPVPPYQPEKSVTMPSVEVDQCVDKGLDAFKNLREQAQANFVDDTPCPTKGNPNSSKQKRDIKVEDPLNQCIPLVSQNIAANPYHADLIGVDPNTVLTRSGYG